MLTLVRYFHLAQMQTCTGLRSARVHRASHWRPSSLYRRWFARMYRGTPRSRSAGWSFLRARESPALPRRALRKRDRGPNADSTRKLAGSPRSDYLAAAMACCLRASSRRQGHARASRSRTTPEPKTETGVRGTKNSSNRTQISALVQPR
jgi:hypothetical protein